MFPLLSGTACTMGSTSTMELHLFELKMESTRMDHVSLDWIDMTEVVSHSHAYSTSLTHPPAGWHRIYFWYSQKTVGLAAPGGSGTWYPAHGCQKICMKGRMAALFTRSGFRVRGVPGSNNVYCHYGYDLQEDINFYMQ